MKILILTSTLYERSGWGRYSRGMVENLQHAGVEMVLLCDKKPNGMKIEWHRLMPSDSALSFLRNVFAVRRLARKVDVVHALDGWPFGVYGYLGISGLHKKLFINGVGTYSVAPLYSIWTGWLLRQAYKAAEGIFCISAYIKNQLILAGISSNKLTIVHMGSDKLPAISWEEEEKYRNELSIDRRRYPIILTVGAIKNRKGQLDTLKAIEQLKGKYPQILYIAAGSGNLDGYIKDMHVYAVSHRLVDNLLMVSNVDDKKLAFLYSKCTLVALNSNNDEIAHHFEGFGLAITEGYQFGKPAVGSRDCGIEDAIEDGKTGFLANQGDFVDIAKKIEQVLENLPSFSSNAITQRTLFDWSKTAGVYLKFYSS